MNEDRLRQLFDETTEPASQPALDRMARAAAGVPEKKRPWLRWPRVAAAVAGVAAIGALAWALDSEEQLGPVAGSERPALPSAPATAEPLDRELEIDDELIEAFALIDDDAHWNGEPPDDLGGDPLAALDGGGIDPFLVLDLLFAPEDEDLDSYLASYELALEGGRP